MGRDYTVQQYDLSATDLRMVANVQQVPSCAPPIPSNAVEHGKRNRSEVGRTVESDPLTALAGSTSSLPAMIDAGSSETESYLSPLRKISKEMDQIEELEKERRDRVGPLSPASPHGSLSSTGRRRRHKERTASPLASNIMSSDRSSTVFSSTSSLRNTCDAASTRSISSLNSSIRSTRFPASTARREVVASPNLPGEGRALVDLFPFTRMRMNEATFRAPQYFEPLTPDVLRREMLSVMFRWENDIDSLVRNERKSLLTHTDEC